MKLLSTNTEITQNTTDATNTASSSCVQDIFELVKARLTALVLVTTLIGFLFGSKSQLDYSLLFHTLLSTALVAAGAAALNQVMEIDLDRLMRRTRDRPLPAGRIALPQALLFGLALSVIGLTYMGLAVNLLATGLAFLTSATYLLIYTPLKQKTVHNTIIGAVSGAIPPVIGWAGATGRLGLEAVVLFGILFFWQMPHFLSIAWIYREQYEKAGYRMWPMIDREGVSTAQQIMVYTVGLLAITVAPFALGLNSPAYLVATAVLGGVFFYCSLKFYCRRSNQTARKLFFATLLYLPLVLGALVFTMLPQ